jgi:dTDP-4-dehydrorhamnose reductase
LLVTGAGGMVGRAVTDYCRSEGDEVFAYDHATLDISDQRLVRETLEKAKPEAVINCAAWTDVDGCEREPARAKTDNTEGPENLAIASRAVGALLVTISTDYVFDGVREGFYTQRDDPSPQSVYGLSKLDGERRAQVASARTIVVRSGFIFGPGGSNFLSSLAERVRRGERITAIGDAWGTPTYSRHLAARLRQLAQLDLPGIYHVVNSGEGASYAEFGRAVAEALGHDRSQVESGRADDLKRPAPRPRNSRLQCLLSEGLGLAPLPNWQDAVRDFVTVV